MPQPKSEAPVTTGLKVSKIENGDSRPVPVITMGKSVTKTENYNSTKVSLEITVGVNPTGEELKNIKKTVTIIDEVLEAEMLEQLKGME